MNDFKCVVELFRTSNYPHFDGAKFSASIAYNAELKTLLKQALSRNFTGGSFEEVEIDGVEFYDDEIPESGSLISYTFKVARRSAEKFYTSRDDFVVINTLKKGEIPEHYYIVGDNYYSFDNFKPEYIVKIEKICLLISYLSKLAHFHDIKSDASGSFYRLVFVLHSESKSSTAVIETNLSPEMLNDNMIDVSLVSGLSQLDTNKDPHYLEKINTFRNTLIEYVSGSNNSFENIVKNWNKISELYTNNLSVYMSAFSFHRARKEVADAEIDYAEKTSKIVSEIANKALAIPISLVASIAIFQIPGEKEAWLTFSGVLLTSSLTALFAASQNRQLARITHAKDTLFSSIDQRLDNEQSDIKLRLHEAKMELNKNEAFCSLTLHFISLLAWMPTSVGILGVLMKYL